MQLETVSSLDLTEKIEPYTQVSKTVINAFCQKWQITEMGLFGSILRDDFRPDSDIDILVTFDEQAKWSLFDIIQMQRELKTLFNREVDLVQKAGLKNPFRRDEILRTTEIIYAS